MLRFRFLLTMASSIFFTAGIIYSQSAGPGNLQAVTNGTVINLTWSAPSSGAAVTYNIYKAAATSENNSGNYTGLKFSKLDSTKMTVYQDSLGTKSTGAFVYYVTAEGKDGTESPPSNYAKVKTGK